MDDLIDLPPEEIERRSFELITAMLGDNGPPPETAPIVTRVIHATADFDFAGNLFFSEGAVTVAREALLAGCHVVTDTQMALAGINRGALARLGCAAHCHIADPDVAEQARADGCTRSRAAVDKAVRLWGDAVQVIGNAPTALIRLCELMREGRTRPRLVIAAPVGFVNVVESKEMVLGEDVPRIVARGRKGGSGVAAAIVNALLYLTLGMDR